MINIQRSPENFCIELEFLLIEYCRLLEKQGISIIPYTSECLKKFSRYPENLQSKIYFGFVEYVSAIVEIIASDVPLQNTAQSLWCLFKKHQLRPTSDLFSAISEKDVVEIYLPNEVQWYRSFNYFKYTSYSLGELICIPWDELIEHDGSHFQELATIVHQILSDKIKKSVFPGWGPMISRERFSAKRLIAKLETKILSPIVGLGGQNEALIVAWNIEILGENGPLIDTNTSSHIPDLNREVLLSLQSVDQNQP